MRNGWVVPPLRRFSSMAYADQPPAASRFTTKSTANRPRAPSLASRSPMVDRRLADQSRVGRVGREDAAEVALPARAAEKLIMS